MNILQELNQPMRKAQLNTQHLPKAPWQLLGQWLQEAINNAFYQPNAMQLATSTLDGRPSVRTLLLKSFDTQGLYFYTNYLSQKGHDLAENPQAEALFYWDKLERQIRVFGKVHKVSKAQSQTYFNSRSRDSQIGALASMQSQIIEGRETLENQFNQLAQQYQNPQEEIPLPDYWGGYCLVPQQFEFWQGRESRLHDRIRYRLTHQNEWLTERLAP